MDPGGYLVANIVALDTIVEGAKVQYGQRIYRSLVGSDSTGHVMSEIETQIPINAYSIVVAEVFPGPVKNPDYASQPLKWTGELAFVSTSVCSDIEDPQPRACVYGRVPGSALEVTAPTTQAAPTPSQNIGGPSTGR